MRKGGPTPRSPAQFLWRASRRLRSVPCPHPEDTWPRPGLRVRARAGRGPLGVLVVPGLGGTAAAIDRWGEVVSLCELARLGTVAMAVDLTGRGRSAGPEDTSGLQHQEDVRAALRSLAARDDVGPVAVISLSLGCGAVAGALAEGERPPVEWWLDWEGPSDREAITTFGTRMDIGRGHGWEDDAWWEPREPVRTVGHTGVPWIRYQSAIDHAQPGELRHATRMLAAAAAGDLPWFQLNDHTPGEVPVRPRWMPAGTRAARRWILEQVARRLPR